MSSTCPIHQEPMTEREGKFGPFWSHKTDDPNYNGWCNGKPPKASPNSQSFKKFEEVGEQIKRGADIDPDWMKEDKKELIDYEPKTEEQKMWRAKEERERITFEVKQQRDLRNQLATAALRELINHTDGKLDHQSTLDNLYHWVWTGEWEK